MRTRLGVRRAAGWAAVLAAGVAAGGWPATTAGATPPATAPDAPPLHAAGTWGACGSWWTQTPTRTESGSVCGVDGLVNDNGQLTQLAEPLITVSRYACFKRKADPCEEERYTGTVKRSEMTVDPFLRRASIRGTLGGCTLDVEFAGFGSPRPQGGVWENHGLNGSTPTISVGGSQTFTSQASWWGGVCGRTIVPPAGRDQGHQARMFRGVEARVGGFGGGGGGCFASRTGEPATAC
jgi:hypothetical protein